jgi:methionyl-tRNA formyltransferase
MQMDAGLDTGDILLEQPVEIPDGTTAGQLHDDMAKRAGPAVLQVLEGVAQGTVTPRKQLEEGITYAAKISKEEAKIDWHQPTEAVRQHILGLSPYPAAYFEYEGEKIKLLDAVLADGEAEPGTVLDDQLTIACASGAIRPLIAQRPGKKPMAVEEMLRGFAIGAGARVD